MPLVETQPDAVSKIYAQSLFELARGAGGQARIEEAGDELEAVVEMARADAKFGEFLSSRIVALKDRKRTLETIFRGKLTDNVLNFLLVLNKNGRLGKLTGIAAAFDQLLQTSFGRVEVNVYTAGPATGEDLASLRAQLQQSLGREPVLHAYTEPAMIGGIKIQIGDRLIDGSVSTRLRKVREQIDTNGSATVKAAAHRIIRPDPSSNGH